MKILMVLTSHGDLGTSGEKTGFWLEEFAAPYYAFKEAGADVVLASPLGGQPPLDPKSDSPAFQTEATHRFMADDEARASLASTLALSEVSTDYDAVFFPGGHGPLWDLAEDPASIALIESMFAAHKPVAAVCHGPGVFRHAKASDGTPLVRGKHVTGFTNTEEEAIGLTGVVPFSVENMLVSNGAIFSRVDDWQSGVVTDGNLITGQNPASSVAVARAVVTLLATATLLTDRTRARAGSTSP
jgi:putative intracellular protease/amidase